MTKEQESSIKSLQILGLTFLFGGVLLSLSISYYFKKNLNIYGFMITSYGTIICSRAKEIIKIGKKKYLLRATIILILAISSDFLLDYYLWS
ncbi:hypothetical protein ACFVRR_17430 [Gottfriedia sp. NPDC057948]|uniref:hypothetical protein n=1 Tax=Gottfriedia sp. NPDC057948 TaxID=3346287 RepID=UPI0036DD6331